ncbi:MAG: glycerol-3-phosphate dehydrogenase [Gammaproteobacteria bacterium]|nr:glycerol-3-phosphate dehydrogenase [Gammaproteobacteria bacterium]MDP2140355.1 glycerol-3-phosphate dehydrogenase [Gammaproteobacteria bacterium]MDP2346128.1 glycerol-3-phosphate dehydrogenase [Gammaproteobacteria bacterium]
MSQKSTIHDLLVIGGGINGAGIAADAAGRGLDVVLCEMNDLASGTSSASTKLIHGGLRYLEQYEFRLVREALAEREVLLRNAPHIITPMRFQLPHRPHLRPRWMIRAGLYLYDFLSQRVTLPASRSLRFSAEGPLVPELRDGFEYSDAWVDDARLVVLVAMQAREHGAQIRVHSRCVAATIDEGVWLVTLQDERDGSRQQVRARVLINAAGPWVGQFAIGNHQEDKQQKVRLVKGCHIVVPRLYEGAEAFLLQNGDGRVVFVIPYQNNFTLIGTTEEDFIGDPSTAQISPWEIDYLVGIVNECFRNRISPADVVHHFAGVRPLLGGEGESASKVSRDYTLDLDISKAPVLTVYGGKITTYRRLAETAMERLHELFPQMGKKWTADARLPGGDFPSQAELIRDLQNRHRWLPESLLTRWAGSYGSLVYRLLTGVGCLSDLGEDLGHGLYAREVDYLVREEWAVEVDDILWRRSKLGLYFSAGQRRRLAEYLASY